MIGYLTVVNTFDAVVQERQGIRGIGLGQLVTAKDAICVGGGEDGDNQQQRRGT